MPAPALVPSAANAQPLAVPPPRWIVSARYDGWFFFASALLAVGAGTLAIWHPAAILPLWFGWIWLIEGPHLFATWQRTYFDPDYRRQHARLLSTSLLWLTPGVLCWLLSQISGHGEVFLLFLGAATLWSFHHAIRQFHGIQSLYQRLHQSELRARQQDKVLLHSSLWLAYAVFLLAHPANREQLGLSAHSVALDEMLLPALIAALVLAPLWWCSLLLLRWRRKLALLPGLFGLLVAGGTTFFSLFVVGNREPLLANAATPEQVFMAATIVTGGLHGIHYLGMVVAASGRRAATPPMTTGLPSSITLAQRLGRQPWLAYGLLLALSVLYVALNLLRGGAPLNFGSGLNWAPDSAVTQGFLAVYWGLFFHHYWLDQHIWKPSKDAQLRHELNLESP